MNVHAPAIALEPQDRGHQRRAGLHGQRGRAAHHPGLLAEELHLDAAAGEIAVTDQADNLAGPQPLDQDGEPWRPAAGRQHLHAEPLAERDEPVIDRLRLHPLDHGGHRACPLGDDPCASQVVVAHVRQGENHPAAGREVPERGLDVPGVAHPRGQPARPASPAAGRPRASTARTSASPAWTARAARRLTPGRRSPGAGCPQAPGPPCPGGARHGRRHTGNPTGPRTRAAGTPPTSPDHTRHRSACPSLRAPVTSRSGHLVGPCAS